jgi:hypothetical protein
VVGSRRRGCGQAPTKTAVLARPPPARQTVAAVAVATSEAAPVATLKVRNGNTSGNGNGGTGGGAGDTGMGRAMAQRGPAAMAAVRILSTVAPRTAAAMARSAPSSIALMDLAAVVVAAVAKPRLAATAATEAIMAGEAAAGIRRVVLLGDGRHWRERCHCHHLCACN